MSQLLELNRQQLLVIFCIILLGFIPRTWNLFENLQIHFDQGLHSLAIWNIWHEGKLSLLGHQTDTDGIFHGPLYYWLMIPAYVLGRGDPAAASLFQITLEAVSLFFLASLARKLFNFKVALLTVFLYSISYGYASYARWLSNITPTFPFSIIFAWIVYHIYQGRIKFLPLAAFFASLITQMDGAIGVFLYPILVWVTLQKNNLIKLNWKILSISLISLIIPHIPLLFFELRHNFVVTHSILRLSGSGSQGIGISTSILSRNFTTLFVELFHLLSYPLSFVTSIILIITAVVLVLRRHPSQTFLTSYILIFFFSLSLYQRGAAPFFFVPLFPLISVLFARTLLLLPRLLFWILFITIVGLNVYEWRNFLVPHHALTPIGTFNIITNQDRKNIVDRIYISAAGRLFAVWIYTIPYHLDDPWLYYFVWYGQARYGYLPLRTGGFSPGDLPKGTLFYNIYEPDDNQPIRLSLWLDEVTRNFGNVDFKYSSNDAITERRIFP